MWLDCTRKLRRRTAKPNLREKANDSHHKLAVWTGEAARLVAVLVEDGMAAWLIVVVNLDVTAIIALEPAQNLFFSSREISHGS